MGLSKGKDHPHCHEKSAPLFPTPQCLLAGHPIEIIMVQVKPIGSDPSRCWCQYAISLATSAGKLYTIHSEMALKNYTAKSVHIYFTKEKRII